MFTAEERQYLSSLPAVYYVGAERILYTDEFKYACIARYMDGESPVAIFREAGLDPELVGHKRIERCFARWRDSEGIRRRLSVDRIRMQQERAGSAMSTGTAEMPDAASEPSDVEMATAVGSVPLPDAPRGVIAAGIAVGIADPIPPRMGPSVPEGGVSDGASASHDADLGDGAMGLNGIDESDAAARIADAGSTDHTDGIGGVDPNETVDADGAVRRIVCMTHDDGCLHTRMPGEPVMMSKGDVLRIRREAVANAVRGENTPNMWNGGRQEFRDLLIDQQTRRIDELEHEITQLRTAVARSTAVMEHAFARHAARSSSVAPTASAPMSASSASASARAENHAARAESRAAHPAGGTRP